MPIIRFDELEKFDKFGSDCVCFAQANKRLPEEKRKKVRRQWQAAPQANDPTPFPAPSKSSGVPVGAVRYYWQRHFKLLLAAAGGGCDEACQARLAGQADSGCMESCVGGYS